MSKKQTTSGEKSEKPTKSGAQRRVAPSKMQPWTFPKNTLEESIRSAGRTGTRQLRGLRAMAGYYFDTCSNSFLTVSSVT